VDERQQESFDEGGEKMNFSFTNEKSTNQGNLILSDIIQDDEIFSAAK
jgi:hypothetical protein